MFPQIKLKHPYVLNEAVNPNLFSTSENSQILRNLISLFLRNIFNSDFFLQFKNLDLFFNDFEFFLFVPGSLNHDQDNVKIIPRAKNKYFYVFFYHLKTKVRPNFFGKVVGRINRRISDDPLESLA